MCHEPHHGGGPGGGGPDSGGGPGGRGPGGFGPGGGGPDSGGGPGGGGPGGGRGGPDTGFVHFEVSEVVRSAGHRAFEEAVHKTLAEFIQEELRSRYGDEFKELASMAVEQAMTELMQNAVIEKLVKDHKEQEKDLRDRTAALIARFAEKSAPSE